MLGYQFQPPPAYPLLGWPLVVGDSFGPGVLHQHKATNFMTLEVSCFSLVLWLSCWTAISDLINETLYPGLLEIHQAILILGCPCNLSGPDILSVELVIVY